MGQASRDRELVAAAKGLYMKYEGRQIRRVVAEVRAAGWPKFNSTILYASARDRSVGWVERFGWKEELRRRKKASEMARARHRATFEYWLRRVSPEMKWTAPHHVLIRKQLRRVTSGEVKRLMIFLPLRCGKSELVTVRYALWRLVRQPQTQIIIGCYNQELANRFSRKMRALAFRRVKLAGAPRSAEEWETAAGGGVRAVGIGAGITGYGGDLIIIDDPVKSRSQANSRAFRERTWNWYKDDIHTRLEPGAAVILIQTRWHDDDLAGRLLKDMHDGGERWEVIRLPTLAEGYTTSSHSCSGNRATCRPRALSSTAAEISFRNKELKAKA